MCELVTHCLSLISFASEIYKISWTICVASYHFYFHYIYFWLFDIEIQDIFKKVFVCLHLINWLKFKRMFKRCSWFFLKNIVKSVLFCERNSYHGTIRPNFEDWGRKRQLENNILINWVWKIVVYIINQSKQPILLEYVWLYELHVHCTCTVHVSNWLCQFSFLLIISCCKETLTSNHFSLVFAR